MMQATILRLESFDRAPPAAIQLPALTRDDLDDAFRRGLEQGRTEAEAGIEARLAESLANAARIAQDHHADLAAQTRRATAAAAPVVQALLTGILPSLTRARLQAAVMAELDRLTGSPPTAGLTLICDPDTEPFLTACLARLGITDTTILGQGDKDRIEIALGDTHVVFDQAAAERELSAIIADALTGE